eukprot:m.169106 g.169106  ORF g.169106 m.169106 type:complete len:464 (+) comp18228_c0_seq1:333-1724(+)
MASVDATDSKVVEDVDNPVAAAVNTSEPPKKRRGRPPKNAEKGTVANDDTENPAADPVPATSTTNTNKPVDSEVKQLSTSSETADSSETKHPAKRGRKPKKGKTALKEEEPSGTAAAGDEGSTEAVATLTAAAKAIADGTATEIPVPTTAGGAGKEATDGATLPSVPDAVAAPGPEGPPTTAGSDAVGSTDTTGAAASTTQSLPEGVPVPPKPGASTTSKRGSVTHSEQPGNGKRPRVVLEVKMNEGGWEKELLEMSTVNLNKFLKSSQYTEEQMNGLKKTRRRVKNRIYAQRSRARKVVLNPDGTKVTPKKAKKAAEKAAKAAAEAAKVAAEAAKATNGDSVGTTSDLAAMIVDGVNKYDNTAAKDTEPAKMEVDPAAKAANGTTAVKTDGTETTTSKDTDSSASAANAPETPAIVSIVSTGESESAPVEEPVPTSVLAESASDATPLFEPAAQQPAVQAAQ